jgi:hypothetical protein
MVAVRSQSLLDLVDNGGGTDVDQGAGTRVDEDQSVFQLKIRSPCWSMIWRALASENSTASS